MLSVLGIDPGLASTGYGIIQVNAHNYKYITSGVIKTKPGEPTGKRLFKIYAELIPVIKKYKPVQAGIEKIFFAKNAKTALPVAEAKGVILFCLASLNISCREYTPLEVKQALLGKGRAEKNQLMEMVKIIFNLPRPPKENHEADALAVALCHYHNACTGMAAYIIKDHDS